MLNTHKTKMLTDLDRQLDYHTAMVETLKEIRIRVEAAPIAPEFTDGETIHKTAVEVIRLSGDAPVKMRASRSGQNQGRKHMSNAERQRVSRRMKKYWAKRRKAAAR